jgi:hypothetical protein
VRPLRRGRRVDGLDGKMSIRIYLPEDDEETQKAKQMEKWKKKAAERAAK